MVEPIERDFHNVIVGIVGDADKRRPFRLYLIARIDRRYLRHLGLQEFRYRVEKRTPLLQIASLMTTSSWIALSGIVHCLLAPVLIAHEPEHAAKREDCARKRE